MSAPELLTVQDVAQRLRVAARTVWRWSKSGALPAPLRLGPARRTIRWKAADIDDFLRRVLDTLPTRDSDLY